MSFLCSSEPGKLAPLPYTSVRYIHYSNKLNDFSVVIPRCYKDVNSFFPNTTKPWNFLTNISTEYFPLIYNVNGFKSEINRHLKFLGSFLTAFLYVTHLFLLLFLAASSLVVVVSVFHEVNPS